MNAEHRASVERLMGALITAAPSERRELVAIGARALGVSERTLYRWIGELGGATQRARRRDHRQSVLTREMLERAARHLALARNKWGEANLPESAAWDDLKRAGILPADVSLSQFRRRLRQEGLSLAHMRAPKAAVARVSRHPNHVWQIDVSTAIQWYFRDAAGKRLDMYMDAGARFNANKIGNYREVRRFIHRYVAIDHCTGAYYVRYYYSAGENAEDMVDFLWHAMAAKEDPAQFPFQGIPKRLVMDQGPANKSAAVRNLLAELGVILELHGAGNAPASGSVEKGHDVWQRRFEGRLGNKGGAADLEELNDWATQYAAILQSETPHSRHGRPPLAAWMDITQEQLVFVPDRKTFFGLSARAARTGKLTNNLYLEAGGRKWQVEGEGVVPRAKVLYRLTAFGDVGVRVWDLEGRELAVVEISTDKWGFAENGRMHVWDDANHKGDTATRAAGQVIAAAVEADPGSARMPNLFDDLAVRASRQRYLARAGRDWEPAATSTLAAPAVISGLQARINAADRLGRDLTPTEAEAWKARTADGGLTEADFDAAFAAIHEGVPEAARQHA